MSHALGSRQVSPVGSVFSYLLLSMVVVKLCYCAQSVLIQAVALENNFEEVMAGFVLVPAGIAE